MIFAPGGGDERTAELGRARIVTLRALSSVRALSVGAPMLPDAYMMLGCFMEGVWGGTNSDYGYVAEDRHSVNLVGLGYTEMLTKLWMLFARSWW